MLTKLRQIRLREGMTLRQLGARVGKSKQYMSELERGNIRLTYDMAVKIAQVFGQSPDDLFLPDESNTVGHGDGYECRDTQIMPHIG